MDLHRLGAVMWGREEEEKEDEGETFFSARLCIPPNNGGLENSSTGQGPSQTWVVTNTSLKINGFT